MALKNYFRVAIFLLILICISARHFRPQLLSSKTTTTTSFVSDAPISNIEENITDKTMAIQTGAKSIEHDANKTPLLPTRSPAKSQTDGVRRNKIGKNKYFSFDRREYNH